MQPKPRSKKKTSLIEPTRVFIVLLAVAVVFFLPIVAPGDEERDSFAETYPALNPLASSADACPWNCIQCTSWDEDSWPKNCLTYECVDGTTDCAGDDGGGGGPSYSPPTISHVLNCSVSGNGDWCIGALTLDLTAFDPQGQSVIISGDVNGVAFACPSGQTTCSIPLPEGTGTANYKVDSATGLSASGSTTWQLDVTTPQISGNVSGPKPYFFGLIKIKTAIISVNPLSSPTMIAGTLAHEGYHCLTPGNTQLEEYNAFRIGDEVRYDIIQAGYGNVNTDMRFPLSEYNINTSNPNLGQLIQDLNTWFNTPPHRMPKYVLPAAQGGYDMTPLPTMPTATLPPTSTPSFTQTPTSTQTQTPTPTSTPKPNQIGENQ